jgi:polyribonucleotide nucleotidyltransferase
VKVRVEKQIGEFSLVFETGELAKQATAAVVARYGDTTVLNAVTSAPSERAQDFFPLTCDYRERTAAAGKFPGGFIKREGRPSMKDTLTSRLIDRPIRPLFPEGFRHEVQCQCIVFSSDRQHDSDVVAMNGVAAALFISPLPITSPVGAVRVGRVEGQLIAFPGRDQLDNSDLDLIVAGTEQEVSMIEGFARELPEDDMLAAIRFAHDVIREICALQRELYDKVGTVKAPFEAPPPDPVYQLVREKYYDEFRAVEQTEGKQARKEAVAALKQRATSEVIPDPAAEGAVAPAAFDRAWHELESRVIRDLILVGKRTDGRDLTTLRQIDCCVDLLPRTHGSALFQRGETQAMITITLGTPRDEQRVEDLVEEYSKKFMLDYNFPPFSVGECRPIRGPGRREIGHGALAERSIKSVLPDPEDFPYTIRVISDILESNGSSSMATVCGATLGLMAAGVPITNPVAGISVGLVKEAEQWVLLTDIIGDEDHFGDMDFKIAGTQNGITGIQLDLKIAGISEDIIRATLAQSRETRIEILRKMLTTISRPRSELSPYAPRLIRLKIDPEKIGALIGPGGKNIRMIQETTGTVIEVEDDGTVIVASNEAEASKSAVAQIEACTATVQIGRIYDGRVISIKDFGAFVEILPGRDGLCHISELSNGFVSRVSDVCAIGDEMKVLVIDIDDHDRVKLSRRRALEELGITDDLPPRAASEDGENPDRERDRDSDRDRGGDRGGDRGDRGGDRGGGGRSRRSGGGGGGGRPRR